MPDPSSAAGPLQSSDPAASAFPERSPLPEQPALSEQSGQHGRVEQLSTRVAYETPWIRVREDEVRWPGGVEGVYSVVERADYALIVPRERDGFWLVEQYRYPIGRRTWEFPSGGWPHDSPGGDAEALARAELREETGLRAGRLRPLGRLSEADGFVAQSFDVFLAEDLEHGEPEREETEQDMRQQWFPDAEVAAMVRSGAIVGTSDVAALGLFWLDRGLGS
ncbi:MULTISPECIES: NUDIX hydrolase [unclassified Rathayibacter]|uniref:NUDIX domain-containing protein n=1 Tax=unclassified Rathayibacter TaxID=2609250 RepID=UPI000FB1978C|nr:MULTISPECIES: NUDIX hydrolase [unclassified Rathayibacter]MCJ1704257.1 NUDIX hydrolase [Rathayibacter sp. VKM Ac-2926]ROP44056.1 ADP-ribose pyrophosphatase YjhB (NUDIX family) [Rathayibacter sp. PhB186]ROS46749.1 ADP-ribose pyrophosphatase YjhB (NUDIX family) [Rathayibacter sp. PhB185]